MNLVQETAVMAIVIILRRLRGQLFGIASGFPVEPAVGLGASLVSSHSITEPVLPAEQLRVPQGPREALRLSSRLTESS